MAVIGSLAVNLVANTDKFIRGLANAQLKLGQFSTKIGIAGAAVSAAIGGMFYKFEQTGSQLHDLSVATGIGVEQLSFLKYAAEQSGSGLEALSKAAKELQKQGIDPQNFERIAASLAAIEDPTERAQKTFEIFTKRAGGALLPMLKDLPMLKKRFEDLGGSFTGKMADAADALGDSWGDLKLALLNITNQLAFALTPAVTALSGWIAENGKAIRDWVAEHSKLVAVLVGVTGLLALSSSLLLPLNAGVQLAIVVVPMLAFVFNALSTALLATDIGFKIATISMLAFGAVLDFLLLNPIVLWVLGVTAAVVALVAILERFFGLWTKFKNFVGIGDVNLGIPGFRGAPTGDKQVAANTGMLVKKTEDTNMLLKELSNKQPGKSVAFAGIR